MSGLTDTVADPPLPYDDSAVYEGHRLILNRIDEEWPCRAQLPDVMVAATSFVLAIAFIVGHWWL
jgi:hypothetical protein